MSTTTERTTADLPVYLTSTEVAEVLKVDPSTLCRWRQQGTGPRVTWLAPTIPRYAWTDVAKWLRESAA